MEIKEENQTQSGSGLESSDCYAKTVDELTNRIVALIAENPHILTMESAWDLFKVDGFDCKDIGPSLAQAQWALNNAKRIHSQA